MRWCLPIFLLLFILACGFGPEQNDDLWEALPALTNEQGEQLNAHDLFLTSNNTLLLTGYFDNEEVDCGAANLFNCKKYRIFRSTDQGGSWTEVTDESYAEEQNFLNSSKISGRGILNTPGVILTQVLSPLVFSDQFKVSRFLESGEKLYHLILGQLYMSENDGLTWSKVTTGGDITTYDDFIFFHVFEDYVVCKTRSMNAISIFKTNKEGLYDPIQHNKTWESFVIYHNKDGSSRLIKPGHPLTSDFYLNNGTLDNTESNVLPNKVFEIVEMPNGHLYSTIESERDTKFKHFFLWKSTNGGKSFSRVNLCASEQDRIAWSVVIIGKKGPYLFLRSSEKDLDEDIGSLSMDDVHFYILNTNTGGVSKFVFPSFSLFEMYKDDLLKITFQENSGTIFLKFAEKVYKSTPQYISTVTKDPDYNNCGASKSNLDPIFEYDLINMAVKCIDKNAPSLVSKVFPEKHFQIKKGEKFMDKYDPYSIRPVPNLFISHIPGSEMVINLLKGAEGKHTIRFVLPNDDRADQVSNYFKSKGFVLIQERTQNEVKEEFYELKAIRWGVIVRYTESFLHIEFASGNDFLDWTTLGSVPDNWE